MVKETIAAPAKVTRSRLGRTFAFSAAPLLPAPRSPLQTPPAGNYLCPLGLLFRAGTASFNFPLTNRACSLTASTGYGKQFDTLSATHIQCSGDHPSVLVLRVLPFFLRCLKARGQSTECVRHCAPYVQPAIKFGRVEVHCHGGDLKKLLATATTTTA